MRAAFGFCCVGCVVFDNVKTSSWLQPLSWGSMHVAWDTLGNLHLTPEVQEAGWREVCCASPAASSTTNAPKLCVKTMAAFRGSTQSLSRWPGLETTKALLPSSLSLASEAFYSVMLPLWWGFLLFAFTLLSCTRIAS